MVTRFLKLLQFLKNCDPVTEWMSVNAEVKNGTHRCSLIRVMRSFFLYLNGRDGRSDGHQILKVASNSKIL